MMMQDRQAIAKQIVDFMAFSERLKTELRHNWLSDGRQESVAEHSYQMALMALLSHQYLEKPVDITRVLKMILVHDLIEAEVGDTPFLSQVNNADMKAQKVLKERAAIEKIRLILPTPVNQEIFDLWHEFEELQSPEAKFTKALDDLEVQVQLNLGPFDKWGEKPKYMHAKTGRHCQHDAFLAEMARLIVERAEEKMTEGGLDVTALREKAYGAVEAPVANAKIATTAAQIVDFMAFSEKLKTVMRHCWLSDGNQESVADHSYQMALLAMLSHPYLEKTVDITRVLKMILVHDLVEAEVGDIPYFDQINDPSLKKQKILNEKGAIDKIRVILPQPINDEIYALWEEYENLTTAEALFVKALNDLEVQIQHNIASFDTWAAHEPELVHVKTGQHCQHDVFLVEIARVVTENAEATMTAGGINVAALRERAMQ